MLPDFKRGATSVIRKTVWDWQGMRLSQGPQVWAGDGAQWQSFPGMREALVFSQALGVGQPAISKCKEEPLAPRSFDVGTIQVKSSPETSFSLRLQVSLATGHGQLFGRMITSACLQPLGRSAPPGPFKDVVFELNGELLQPSVSCQLTG